MKAVKKTYEELRKEALNLIRYHRFSINEAVLSVVPVGNMELALRLIADVKEYF